MVMEFVLSEQKAADLGYTIEACYDVIDRLFAEYGIVPDGHGVYHGPDNQNTYTACTAALHRLPASSWFLHVVKSWSWDLGQGSEDCLESYYAVKG